jgi:hypothetical protein
MLFQRPVKFPTAVTCKSLTNWSRLLGHQKVLRVSFRNGIRTSGVLANPSLEIEDPFRRCSVQKQNTTVTSIVKIPYFLNRLADRVI